TLVVAMAAGLVLLLALAAAAAPAGGQAGPAPESYLATTPLEAELQRELVCTCGDCPHYTLADCRCSSPPRWIARADGSQQLVAAGAEYMRGQLREQIEAGRDRRQILDYFIATYGSQEPLGAPLDEGFNRLAWLLPYLIGAGCLVGVGSLAVRWSRRDAPAEEAASLPEAEDAELDARLDDELRDLD
ncbi:MAG: cytochrome c-type biogenesis protein CcmH, partial [Acidobacteria bacterium]|nr:cytochrome c-type biogenesis protein CcmH [Acidobacteriota bacterium]